MYTLISLLSSNVYTVLHTLNDFEWKTQCSFCFVTFQSISQSIIFLIWKRYKNCGKCNSSGLPSLREKQ